MKMTYDQYINNPMGRKNMVYSNRFVYRDLYTNKLNVLMVREMGKVKYTLYRDKTDYYIYMKVPSEVIKNFYYDVVIQFYTDDKSLGNSRTLKDYYIKFYSNDPAFVFTFAHAMIENDLFIKDLVPRMSKHAVKKVAKERNAKNEIGYVKSIYFAYLLSKRYGLFNKVSYESQSEKYDKKKLLELIEHADSKVEKRQIAEAELRKKKALERKKSHSRTPIKNTSESEPMNVKFSTKPSMVRTVKTSSRIGKSKSVRRSKIIK